MYDPSKGGPLKNTLKNLCFWKKITILEKSEGP